MGFLFSKQAPASPELSPAPAMVQITPAAATVKKSKPTNRVLVIGGSYAGLSAVVNLLQLAYGGAHAPSVVPFPELDGKALDTDVEITLVDEKDGWYHTIGSPLALADANYGDKAWTKYEDIPAIQHKSVTVVQGSVSNLDLANKIATIQRSTGELWTVEYDYAVCCSGLRRDHPTVPQQLNKVDYLEECKEHIGNVRAVEESIVIIGGGAVGVEMASELKLCHPDKSIKLIHSHSAILNSEPLPDEFKATALALLIESGVEPILSERVLSYAPDNSEDKGFTVTLKSGKTLRAGKVIWAISHQRPTTTYLPKEALNDDGLVTITSNLNFSAPVPNAACHFAAGDLAEWSGIKRCGAAMAMAHNAVVNMHQMMLAAERGDEAKLHDYPEVPPMIALACGKKAATYYMGDTQSGEEHLKAAFGDDLGLSICWKYLNLRRDPVYTSSKEKLVEDPLKPMSMKAM